MNCCLEPDLPSPEKCTGCGACAEKCARDAIAMSADNNGYMHPLIDTEKCVGCLACQKVCPVMGESVGVNDMQICYAARCTDVELRRKSSSGGMFSLIAEDVLRRGGVVYGASFDTGSQSVKHVRINDASGIGVLRGSKYVQSFVGGVYKSLLSDVKAGRLVLFSGTPCQIAAVRSLVGNGCRNILLVDVICHGVPSPALFGKLLNEIKIELGCGSETQFDNVAFRDKTYGWRKRDVFVTIADVQKRGTIAGRAYCKAFLSKLSIRASCERCGFNNGHSGADITLGDFWGVERIYNDWNDDTGTSIVILHTEKGLGAFRRLDVESREVPLKAAVKANPSYWAARKPSRKRQRFMALIGSRSISEAYEVAAKQHCVEVFATVCKKLLRRCIKRR